MSEAEEQVNQKVEVDSKFVSALCEAQAGFPDIEKNKINPHFGSKYADLTSIRKAVVPVLAKHGFAFAHFVRSQDGQMSVETKLFHKESESQISCVIPVPSNGGIQGIGSSITYGRRYGLCALLGIVGDDDDDANEAQKEPHRRTQTRSASQTSRTASKGRTAANGASNGHSNGSSKPDESKSGSPQKSESDEKGGSGLESVVVHFGQKLKGKEIGSLPEGSLRWLAEEWEPNPRFKSEKDEALKDAAKQLYASKFGERVHADDLPGLDDGSSNLPEDDIPF